MFTCLFFMCINVQIYIYNKNDYRFAYYLQGGTLTMAKSTDYGASSIKVLEGLTTNSANQILKEVSHILPNISKLSF